MTVLMLFVAVGVSVALSGWALLVREQLAEAWRAFFPSSRSTVGSSRRRRDASREAMQTTEGTETSASC